MRRETSLQEITDTTEITPLARLRSLGEHALSALTVPIVIGTGFVALGAASLLITRKEAERRKKAISDQVPTGGLSPEQAGKKMQEIEDEVGPGPPEGHLDTDRIQGRGNGK